MTWIRVSVSTIVATVSILLTPTVAVVQGQTSETFKAGGIVPLKLVIVIARFQGEKKVSSLPYTISVNANDPNAGFFGNEPNIARLRTGASVPVPSMAPPKESPIQGPVGPVQYKSIGTNIDCSARSTDDGRFRVEISIEDSSVYSEGQTAQGVPKFNDIPSFRSFQASNVLILKDGQATEFTAATDRITGEVTKVTVTLTVVK
jgi:hypothetical protein